MRKGQHVYVTYTEGEGDENYTGPGKFVRNVPTEDWDMYAADEPYCVIKTSKEDSGSVFPTRCVTPNASFTGLPKAGPCGSDS